MRQSVIYQDIKDEDHHEGKQSLILASAKCPQKCDRRFKLYPSLGLKLWRRRCWTLWNPMIWMNGCV